jgi:NADPH-dependent 2,4-dienoyl-CoA reductase/sulfur reductase-like enzyme
MVVGGGLAGLQVAILLAIRGHQVSLYEKNHQLGGQWCITCALPRKQHFTSLTEHLIHSLDKYGISVLMGTKVTKNHVLETKPDVVVLATGAMPLRLDVPGALRSNVVQANDVIEGKVQVKSSVVVVGGRSLAMELAISLAELNKDVILVSRSGLGGKRGPDEKLTYRALMKRLVELHIPMYLNTTVLEITNASVIVRLGDEILALPTDTVVLAVGAKPVNKLVQELEGVTPELYTIGDCVQPGNAAQAIFGAARLALKI